MIFPNCPPERTIAQIGIVSLAEVAQACLADPFVPENVKTEIELFITKHQIG